jgi:hypothetical protein
MEGSLQNSCENFENALIPWLLTTNNTLQNTNRILGWTKLSDLASVLLHFVDSFKPLSLRRFAMIKINANFICPIPYKSIYPHPQSS